MSETIWCDIETWYWHKERGCSKCRKTHRKEIKYYDYENPCAKFSSK